MKNIENLPPVTRLYNHGDFKLVEKTTYSEATGETFL